MEILRPITDERTYHKAVEVFQTLYTQITDKTIPLTDEDHGKDLIIIGSDTVNTLLCEHIVNGDWEQTYLRYSSDDYIIRCFADADRRVLILAGGRGRSTLYAVYDFFERVAGCHYFWDGDVIPKLDRLPLPDLNVTESPRFEYRGLRYFAHRSLHRFQAEHWNEEDWKKELDWLTKRRLNLFMLRIGMDDLWQRAFPEHCDYSVDQPGKGYNDRTPFWDLKYRGELRKKILEYAGELDLIHPEDCGTMSHWYSPAPQRFIAEMKPDFFPQADNRYSSPRTLVWDIRKKRNMDNYMKLTRTAVEQWNPNSDIFHTIGLGERNMMESKEANHRLKKYTLHKINQSLREHYPNAKLMIAAWDFIGWWRPDDVAEFTKELDPEKNIILDYTGEADDELDTFVHWGIVGKFPWIFGLFHGYEPENSLRGPYDRIDQRVKIAKDDPYCKGFVFWPEMSHSDPLILEYLTENSWAPLKMSVEQLTERFCDHRYGNRAAQMNALWQNALPMIKVGDWGGFSRRDATDPEAKKYTPQHNVHQEMWFNMLSKFIRAYSNPNATVNFTHKNGKGIDIKTHFAYKLSHHKAEMTTAPALLRQTAELTETAVSDFEKRDLMDLGRTVLGRRLNFLLMEIINTVDEDKEKAAYLCNIAQQLMGCLGDYLYYHEDYSMYASLKKMEKAHPVTPGFERTLKENFLNSYCRTYGAEPARFLYPKEMQYAFNWLLGTQPEVDFSAVAEEMRQEFIAVPLERMQTPPTLSPDALLRRAADLLDEL